MAQSLFQVLESEKRQHPSSSLDDPLYCAEEQWEGEDREKQVAGVDSSFDHQTFSINTGTSNGNNGCIEPLANRNRPQIRDQAFSWEQNELSNLLSREEENRLPETLQSDTYLGLARRDAVQWMLSVHTHYSFSLLTVSLAINYFDRFLFEYNFQKEKPWMTQLAAVACLSIAAKMEETHVPLLLDLQVQETKYFFDAKTIQRMEILVLSTLEWKMTAPTPYSYLDYMTRRLALEHHFWWEVRRRCERVLLAIYSDCRFTSYLPSVVAAAAMLHVLNNVKTCNVECYQSHVMDILQIDKDKVEECRRLIMVMSSEGNLFLHPQKRKFFSIPASPNASFDVSFSSYGSTGSWIGVFSTSSASHSVSSSPETLAKKVKADQNGQFERPVAS